MELNPDVSKKASSTSGNDIVNDEVSGEAPTTQMPLHMKITDDIDKRLQSADLLWKHTYCRWHEPRHRFTQRTWWLKYKKGSPFPSEEDFPPPEYPRPSCPLTAKEEHTRACIAAYHVQLLPHRRAIKEIS